MAGYGNRTAPDYTTTTTPAHLGAQHAQTRLGAPSTSAPTYGAGYGNKRASLAPTTSAEDYDKASDHAAAESDDERGGGETPLRFDSQTTHGSAPYSGAHTYGSASTAGAGWGNKTGSFSGGGEREDSTLGRVMHKLGGIVHSPALTNKGRAERGDTEAADGQDAQAPVAN